MINDNDLWDQFEQEGLKATDLLFIKELILGHPLPGSNSFCGRDAKKFFLYQVRPV